MRLTRLPMLSLIYVIKLCICSVTKTLLHTAWSNFLQPTIFFSRQNFNSLHTARPMAGLINNRYSWDASNGRKVMHVMDQ
uniref:Putative secreted protein n=2 Tax=Anopheles marajoara TaxID=58244 RepID=A0A2M4CBT3_9DIPT